MLNKMSFFKKSAFISAATFLIFCAASCSLKYSETVNAEETNPEFIFNHAKLTRYEKGKETVVVNADNIEQYKQRRDGSAVSGELYHPEGHSSRWKIWYQACL